MHDAQFELELEQRRKATGLLREQVAPRRKAEADTLAVLEAETRGQARIAGEADTESTQLGVAIAGLGEEEQRLKAGLSRARTIWVRFGEPLVLTVVLFLGLLSVGASPQPVETAKAAGVALVAAGLVSAAWRARRAR